MTRSVTAAFAVFAILAVADFVQGANEDAMKLATTILTEGARKYDMKDAKAMADTARHNAPDQQGAYRFRVIAKGFSTRRRPFNQRDGAFRDEIRPVFVENFPVDRFRTVRLQFHREGMNLPGACSIAACPR